MHGVSPCAALLDDVQIAHARGVVLFSGEGEQVRRIVLEDAAERRQFRDRAAGAVHAPRRVLDVLRRIGAEEQLLARKHVFVYRKRPFEKHRPVVVQDGDFQRIETRNVFHRARNVRRIGAALFLVQKTAVGAEYVGDHVFDRLVERTERIVPVACEAEQTLCDILERIRGVAQLSAEQCGKDEFPARSRFGADAARNRGEQHRRGQSLPVAHGDAETAVGGRRQRIEREFGGVGQNAVCRVAVGDERRRDGTPEREREVTFVGEPFLLPDQRLPDFVGPFRVSPRKTGESDRIPASGFRREAVGEQGPARRGVGRQLRRDAEKVVFGVAEGDLVCSFRTVGDGADDDDALCVEEVGRPRFDGAFEDFIVEAVARLIGSAVRTVQVRAVAEPCSHVVLNVGDVRRTHSQLRVRSRKEDREFRQVVGQEVLPAEHDRMVGFHPEFLRLCRAARSRRGQYDQQYAAGPCHGSRSNFRVCIP